MGVENEPAQVGLLQKNIEAVAVTAFRQPEPARFAAKHFAITVATDANLRALRLGKILKQRKEGVGGGACDDFEAAGVLQFAKCPDDVAPQRFAEEFAGCGEKLSVKARQFGELRVVPVAFDFLLGQPDQSLEVPEVTLLEQFVAQHRAEGGGERHRELESRRPRRPAAASGEAAEDTFP